MKITFLFIPIILLYLNSILFISCEDSSSNTEQNVAQSLIPYDLSKFTKKISLDHELLEISALSYYKDNLLACLQDEDGIIYLIDIDAEEIVKKIRVQGKGDYEGIETVGDTAYIMKSNGQITRVVNFTAKSPEIKIFDLGFKNKNNCEGLAYNTLTDEFLIACKGKAELADDVQKSLNLPELKKYRAVYKVNRQSMKIDINPKYLLEKKEYEKLSQKDNFKPSAITIQPISENIYILASAGKLLVVLDKYGNYFTHVQLNPKIFIQPEGICFSPDGQTLFISNEGKTGKGNILIFKQN